MSSYTNEKIKPSRVDLEAPKHNIECIVSIDGWMKLSKIESVAILLYALIKNIMKTFQHAQVISQLPERFLTWKLTIVLGYWQSKFFSAKEEIIL